MTTLHPQDKRAGIAILKESIACLKKEIASRERFRDGVINSVRKTVSDQDDQEIAIAVRLLAIGEPYGWEDDMDKYMPQSSIASLKKELASKQLNLDMLTGKASNIDTSWRDKMKRAKQFPIENMIKVNSAGFAKCLWHKEATASMKLYRTNSVHCFGCKKTADAIDVAVRVYSIDFKDAVDKLSTR